MDHEYKIISLVNDVADVLEKAAVGSLHTPALYSVFLRALVSAKTEPTSHNDEQHSLMDQGPVAASHEEQLLHASNVNQNASAQMHDALADFQFEGEMGPVIDMSTFPPTMASNLSEDHMGMLTMDSILSASFWDSVLVPGMFIFLLTLMRVL